MEEVLRNEKKLIMLGNEAMVRGALESGVEFVATYPGTPSSEIGDIFSRISQDRGICFEYSVNEKTALEAVIGASFSGKKSLVAMKNFGLNVCADSLIPFCYTGSRGPTVMIVGDDPSCHSSAQSEQNSRGFAFLAQIPILEPSDSQECRDFIKLAFLLSEKFKLPVMVRTTTRVAHQRSQVSLDKIPVLKTKPGRFIRDRNALVTMPPRVLAMHRELLDKIEKLRKFAETSPINRTEENNSPAGLGIIASGISYLYAKEALKEIKVDLSILKLGFFFPLPEEKIKSFLKKCRQVLIVEELDPYLEKEVCALAKEINPSLKIFGKSHLSATGELRPEQVTLASAKILKKPYSLPKKPAFEPLKHLPRFCSGAKGACPYWKVFASVKKATLDKEVIFGGDIGCYMIAALPPHNLYDYLSAMGSSLGIAHGVKKSTNQKVIAFIGDSTFFHAGLPALINIVYNKSNPLIIILENSITAMTGFQPHPGAAQTAGGELVQGLKIEEILKALQIKNWRIIDPVADFEEMTKTIKEFLAKDEVSVIIARRPCWLLSSRLASQKS